MEVHHTSAIRLAIAQMPTCWTIEENVNAMMGAMRLAHTRGASLCTFPELAVTGYHRKIAELARPERVQPAIERLTQLAGQLQLAVAFGAPTFGPDAARYNSHLLVSASGSVMALVHKNGLTPAEASFFTAGTSRPAATLQGLTVTAVICREVEDHGPVLEQLREIAPQLVLWPGLMSPDPDKPVTDPPEHVRQAQRIASAAGAHVVQANWPNSLNQPERSAEAGRSACISPRGELLFRLPAQEPGIAVWDLGQTTFEWCGV